MIGIDEVIVIIPIAPIDVLPEYPFTIVIEEYLDRIQQFVYIAFLEVEPIPGIHAVLVLHPFTDDDTLMTVLVQSLEGSDRIVFDEIVDLVQLVEVLVLFQVPELDGAVLTFREDLEFTHVKILIGIP